METGGGGGGVEKEKLRRIVLERLGSADELCHAGTFMVSLVAEAREGVGKMKGKWACEILPRKKVV